jgi:hypothetical protein
MRITRSSKTTISFATQKKRDIINEISDEYSRVANIFTEMFFGNNFQKKDLKKDITNIPESWLSARMRQCCAREAPGMVRSAVMSAAAKGTEAVKPVHTGRKMILSSQCVRIEKGRNSFDLWLVIHSVGNKMKLQIPMKRHRHMNLFSGWKMSDSVTVHRKYVMFSFGKETGEKKTEGKLTGIDCGINHLLATSEGNLHGHEVKPLINVIKRKKQASEAYRRAKKTLS